MWLSSLASRAGPGLPAPRAGLETPLLLLVRRAHGHTLKNAEMKSFLPAELPPLAAAAPQPDPGADHKKTKKRWYGNEP